VSVPDAENSSRKLRSDGERSRKRILETAADLATTIGLGGLSIGELARATGMSKGGIAAHFASKQLLQLATIDMALSIFQREVLDPAFRTSPGVPRLLSICEHDLSYIRRRVFPGGCFFSAVAAEFCNRAGSVKNRIAEASKVWLGLLETTIREAVELGQLRNDTDPEQLAFELNGLIVSANFEYMLHEEPTPLDRAEHAINRAVDARRTIQHGA